MSYLYIMVSDTQSDGFPREKKALHWQIRSGREYNHAKNVDHCPHGLSNLDALKILDHQTCARAKILEMEQPNTQPVYEEFRCVLCGSDEKEENRAAHLRRQ